MRFRRLDLSAYGHFTATSIDLSAGNHGLHMIYGPNEAGKSTSLRALTVFLFDFPHSTDDNFLHDNKDLRVGAVLENREGKLLACVRRKAKAAKLLFADSSEEVPASLFSQFVPKISEDQFLRMFGLNHVTLREGGAELVRGGGDSGQALFSSASGIADLQQKRSDLDKKIEDIFAKSGRRGRLFEKLKDYKAIRDQEKQVSLTMDQWRRIEKDLAEARTQMEQHKSQLDRLQRSLFEAQRIERSIPTVRTYLEREQSIKALGQSSKFPKDFEQSVQDTHSQKGVKLVSIQTIDAELKNLQSRIEQIPESFWSDEQEVRVGKLTSGLGLYLKSIGELPKLKTQRDQLKRQATSKWQEIGSFESLKSRLETQRIPTSQKKWIESLAKQYEGFEKQISDAKSRLSKLKKKLEGEAALEQPPSMRESLKLLEHRVQQARPILTKVRELQQFEEEFQRGHTRFEQGIRKWNLSVDGIQAMCAWKTVATASIDRWEKELDKRHDAIEKSQNVLDGLIKKRAAKQRELDREAKKVRVPTRQEWEASKKTRNEAFEILSEHRNSTSERWNEMAQAYEQSRAGADQIAEELLDQADLVAQREQLHESLSEMNAQVDEADQELRRHQSEYESSKGAWQAFLAEHQIAAQTPSEAIEWMESVLLLQQQAQSLLDWKVRIEQTRTAIEHGIAGLTEGLRACGGAVGQDAEFESLLAVADSVLQEASKEQGRAEAIRKQRQLDEQEYQQQSDELHGLEEQFAGLKKQWWEALASVALPERATPVEVQTILEQISELQQTTDQIESTQELIHQCQDQVQSYEAAVEIALDWLKGRSPESLAQLSAQGDAESKVRFLERYGNQAVGDKSRRATLEDMCQKASQRLDQARLEHQQLENQLNEMIEIADAGTQERLLELARNSREFHLLDTDRKQLKERLQDEFNHRDIEPFILKVQQADADEIAIQIKDLTEQIGRTENEREQAIMRHSQLERDYQNLDTGGRASMLATQASGVGIEIEEAVQELATLRLAHAALTAGIERYRAANEDPILKIASESFREMTLGKFRGIEITLDNDGKHLLVGRRAVEGAGSGVYVEQMSDGTRDQLYLSLRLASLEQWNRVHEPMPLVVDDILVHFDDERAVATLKQLVRLSDHTQVIFFTHHQHLIDLAKERLASEKVFFHRLGAT
ncbi:MAG: AAA family ATPase [Pirellula sp.]